MSGIPRIALKKATITPVVGGQAQKAKEIPVHFNPVSLQYTASNTLKEEGSGKNKKQVITQSTGKLSMDLVFDETSTGHDVRVTTSQIAAFMSPDAKASSGKKLVAPILIFEWGIYKFQGMMESYKETLDFFSADGVPLRASVNISLVQQDRVFSSDADKTAAVGQPADSSIVDVPTGNGSGGGNSGSQNAQSAATLAGDPNAARGLATLNGQASMRFSAGASLSVSGSIQLGPPVAFATGGAGISAGAGAGIGISGGAGIGISGGAGIGVSGGAGIGIGGSAGIGVGGSASAGIGGGVSGSAGLGISASAASAGVSATDGAFAGLRVSTQAPTFTLNTNNLLPPTPSLPLATGSNANFQVGGQATVVGTAGLATDVGATADLRARIQFGG
ncbi:MAG: hypothetical protein DMG54_17415 [Acidobacteria bacterium]|nr:MAG: hypothetical protein DMG54_17415 [Acidobacteriota bacterium]